MLRLALQAPGAGRATAARAARAISLHLCERLRCDRRAHLRRAQLRAGRPGRCRRPAPGFRGGRERRRSRFACQSSRALGFARRPPRSGSCWEFGISPERTGSARRSWASRGDRFGARSALGVRFEVVPLEPMHGAVERSLHDVLGRGDGTAAGENVQARLRALVLMSYVNGHGGLLLNTSNKTELSLGYATLYGDMAGTLCPIVDLTKPDVRRAGTLARRLPGVHPRAPTDGRAEGRPGGSLRLPGRRSQDGATRERTPQR